MAYTEPTPDDIRARFPAFASLSDPTIQMFIDEAAPWVDDSWLEADRAPAIRFLTAHKMAAEGLLGTGQVANQISGLIKSESLGDASVTYENGMSTGQGSMDDAWLASTPYGRDYLRLRNANFPAVLNTATG
jgi:hypothetical protein